jgi:hypothetical protein
MPGPWGNSNGEPSGHIGPIGPIGPSGPSGSSESAVAVAAMKIIIVGKLERRQDLGTEQVLGTASRPMRSMRPMALQSTGTMALRLGLISGSRSSRSEEGP